MVGNSVAPQMAEAVVAAQLGSVTNGNKDGNMTDPRSIPKEPVVDTGDTDRTRAMLHGAAYALRRDPDYPGLFQLAVRSSDGVVGVGRLDRDHLRILVADGMSELQQDTRGIERSVASVVLADALRRDLELLGDLRSKDDPVAELLVKMLFDHLKSWQPSLTSGMTPP